MKFGRPYIKLDARGRTLRFADYINLSVLPTPPAKYSVMEAAGLGDSDTPMDANDTLGCCVGAGLAGHQTTLWTALSGKKVIPTVKQVKAFYYAVGRLENPGQRYPDNGLSELDALNYMTKHAVAGEKVAAFAAIDPKNDEHIRQAVMLFGGSLNGFSISDPAQLFREFNANEPWTPEAGTDTEGHCTVTEGWDAEPLDVITWGRRQRGTLAWWRQKVDESWAVIPTSWQKKGAIPAGFDWEHLLADLAAIRSA